MKAGNLQQAVDSQHRKILTGKSSSRLNQEILNNLGQDRPIIDKMKAGNLQLRHRKILTGNSSRLNQEILNNLGQDRPIIDKMKAGNLQQAQEDSDR